MDYSILDFTSQFPNEDVCLEYLFNLRFGKKAICKHCTKVANYSRVKGRKTYACSWCGKTVSPTAGTIMHKSDTDLRKWFFAVFLMSQSRNGVSAKEIERHVKVTYKCAFRMMHKIRSLMAQGGSPFEGTVEVDETYVGGRAKGKRGRGALHKTPVFGISSRDEKKVYAKVVANTRSATLMPLIRENVAIGANVMSDEYRSYHGSTKMGYKHETVQHGIGEYVRGNVHTNGIEGFWSNMKRGIDGTHHAVSPKYLQNYVDEFAYRWNHRNDDSHLFDLLLGSV